MASTSYLDVEQLKAALRIANNSFDDSLQLAIDSASRQIDEHCNEQFWLTDAPVARLFRPEHGRVVWTGSFATTAGVQVELDLDDDGAFETTLSAADWQAEPISPDSGWPYNRIEALGSVCFPHYRRGSYLGERYATSRRARVRVTARWGWPSVPAQVVQACQILAIDHYKSKDVVNGSAGNSSLSTGTAGSFKNSTVRHSGLNPMAAKLICGFRDLVVA